MKVTFVVPWSHSSGGIKVVATYAERLAARGHEVLVVSPEPPAQTLRSRVRHLLRDRRWSAPAAPSHFEGRKVDLRIYGPHRVVEDSDVPSADVIVGTWFETALWVAKLAPDKGAKVIFIQGYETLPEEPRPGVDEAWRLPFHKIVISRWLKELAAEKFADPLASHIPNSVDTKQFFAPARGKQKVPTIGFLAGGDSAFKGMRIALAALAQMRKLIPDLRIISFGLQEPRGDLALPPGSEFHRAPPQDTIRDLYASCDVWLCSSKREGFHLPPLEAMACRCPVVSTRVGGPEDIIQPGKNGYLVAVDDVSGLATACVRVLGASEDDWRSHSDAAWATATRYTWDDATVVFERALTEACARAARGEIAGGRRF